MAWWFINYVDGWVTVSVGQVNPLLFLVSPQGDVELVDYESPPGLFRPLTKAKHFERVVGERVKVKTFSKHDNRKNVVGVLQDCSEGKVCLNVDGEDFAVELTDIAKANLEPEL